MYTVVFTKEELERIKEWGDIVSGEGDDWDSADETAMKKVEETLTASGAVGGLREPEELNQMELKFDGESDEEEYEE